MLLQVLEYAKVTCVPSLPMKIHYLFLLFVLKPDLCIEKSFPISKNATYLYFFLVRNVIMLSDARGLQINLRCAAILLCHSLKIVLTFCGHQSLFLDQ